MKHASVALLLAVAAACSNGGTDTPRQPVALSPPPSSTPPAFVPVSPTPEPRVTAPQPTRTAALGSRLTLSRRDGAAVDVNVLDIADPARGRATPPQGTRWVAVQIEISNPGGPGYREMPADAARLIDDAGNVYAGWASDPVRPGFGGEIIIRTGDYERGFVAFSVPADAQAVAIRFTPEARSAPGTGEWRF